MPFQLLDVILVAIMLISGLLALMRGFTREILSLAAWGISGLAAMWAIYTPSAVALAQSYIEKPLLAKFALGALVFFVVLIVVSIISVKIADWVLESSAGPIDRTAGLFYGLLRGLLLVVIAYLFYVWLLPRDKHEAWVRNAASLPVIEDMSGLIISYLPTDIANTLKGTSNNNDQAGQSDNTTDTEEDKAYKDSEQNVLDQLIESTQQNGQSQ